ncbi:hypothetical protein NM688_g1938 [Phlebia brevispora]|uniref:Uncharacterized protein n=1 Tax=Phlebia brevispora TaxID=194682 RepID=A0ACC1T9T6_9APHY|nr:hypothetical protein NM688_g1938 [Phlebia brevispora]
MAAELEHGFTAITCAARAINALRPSKNIKKGNDLLCEVMKMTHEYQELIAREDAEDILFAHDVASTVLDDYNRKKVRASIFNFPGRVMQAREFKKLAKRARDRAVHVTDVSLRNYAEKRRMAASMQDIHEEGEDEGQKRRSQAPTDERGNIDVRSMTVVRSRLHRLCQHLQVAVAKCIAPTQRQEVYIHASNTKNVDFEMKQKGELYVHIQLLRNLDLWNRALFTNLVNFDKPRYEILFEAPILTAIPLQRTFRLTHVIIVLLDAFRSMAALCRTVPVVLVLRQSVVDSRRRKRYGSSRTRASASPFHPKKQTLTTFVRAGSRMFAFLSSGSVPIVQLSWIQLRTLDTHFVGSRQAGHDYSAGRQETVFIGF